MSNQTVSQEIASTLRTDILRKQYRVGERLPSERELAARFETTRGTIREALKQLEQLGIIDIQLGGVRVKPVEEATLEILGHLLIIDGYPNPQLVDQYLQVFKTFSVMSAEASINLADERQLQEAIDIVETLKAQPSDKEAMRIGWANLFDHFQNIHQNLVMHLISNGLKNQIISHLTSIDADIDENFTLSVYEKLHTALVNRKAGLAGEAVKEYFEWVRDIAAVALETNNPLKSSQ